MIAPIKPNNMPSIKNGQRINPLVAPTYFMIAISLRRANTVNRIVFEMMNSVAAARKAINTIPPIRITCVMRKSSSTIS